MATQALSYLDPPFDYVALVHDRAQALLATFYLGGHIANGLIPRERRYHCIGGMTAMCDLLTLLALPASKFPSHEEHENIRWPNFMLLTTSIAQIRMTLESFLKRLGIDKWDLERTLIICSEGTKFNSNPFSVEIRPQGILNAVAPSLPNTTGVIEPVRVEVPIGWGLEIDSVEFELLKRAVMELQGQLGAIIRAAPPRKSQAAKPAVGERDSKAEKPARHSIDFRSVHWFGTDFSFSPNQAAVVKCLWEQWENGTPEIGDATLLVKAESDCRRIADLFRDTKSKKPHPAWDTVIIAGSTKGTRRLNPPNDHLNQKSA